MIAALTHHHTAVADQERVLAAIVEEAEDLALALVRVTDRNLAITYLEALALRVDAWRTERAVLVRMYVAYRVPARCWRTRVRRGDDLRDLDLDRSLCVGPAWRWLTLPGTLAAAHAHDDSAKPVQASSALAS